MEEAGKKRSGNFGLTHIYCMKKTYFVAILFLLCSCGRSDKPEGNEDAIKNEIKTTIDNYYNDIRKEGFLAEFNYLDSSAQFFWVPPAYLNYAGYNSIAAAIQRNAPLFKSVDNRYDSLLIVPLTKEYAEFVMRTFSTIVSTRGDTARIAFIESGVLAKRKDGWKFLSGHTSVLK
jgi:hypothetical protein